jgi:hypothetical protein
LERCERVSGKAGKAGVNSGKEEDVSKDVRNFKGGLLTRGKDASKDIQGYFTK